MTSTREEIYQGLMSLDKVTDWKSSHTSNVLGLTEYRNGVTVVYDVDNPENVLCVIDNEDQEE